ncbi:ATP-dependent RecD-like DNA helicase [Gluconobacter sp. R71646]|uniref:ATP-dependent RecD2 DNA helicase n=4 Tax=Acetobacteraceae TaxID=433 RepID=A0ABR9YQU0_9PROT|nr:MULTISPECIES: ATP-dependent RecD-like DNA helicase [Acetobacteraceae]MBF0866136.1 ATP-dependent RecD-like DNA helicase [Gluconobacter sp. R71656]MBF0869200.1 ATP-dependent RecD-like DNA helicase [Gluconobacter sp. R75628]MBF0875193.1 ATP-dependent RecD-like DNA helicase [Gluconobacter sp. R75629]MBF0884164.1 ATP-dependent RecD-like DNA helicase [Gluconobacter potus]PYD52435.1 ATP-dependent RecD-like DNA helicase [Komagataeibacter rhaeticus]
MSGRAIDSSPTEALAGLVERVTFHNAENGFCVLRVKVRGQRDLVTVVGHAAMISAGEFVQMSGRWFNDHTHGLQFKAEFLKASPPTTVEGIERYLGSGMIRGIGPVYAKKLVKAFGEAVFDLIEQEPGRLREVTGIGPKRAERIVGGWADQKVIREIMLFLHSNGVGTSRAVRIFKTYGQDAVQLISENPYRLAKDIRGIGFKTADQIARKMGIAADAMIRVRAGISYALGEAMDEGHCGLPVRELLTSTAELLEVAAPLIETALTLELEAGDVIADSVGETGCIFLAGLYRAEQSIAERLRACVVGRPPWPEIDAGKAMTWVERKTGLALAPSQQEAVRLALNSKVLVITGGPGVGKTTLVNAILKIVTAKGTDVQLCAPTGRAAKRLSESTGLEGKTIHRLLETDPASGTFKRDDTNPLTCDLLVVDEASMVDVLLMRSLLRALPDNAALLIVGDVDQLPSVGPGQVLADIIGSNAVPVVRLTEVFRQAAQSRIITNAHRINESRMPELSAEEGSDFYFVEAAEPEVGLRKLLAVVRDRIPARFGLDPVRDVQVLCPMNRGGLGARSLNIELQQALNPPDEVKVERFGWTYGPGDKVMQIANDYDRDVFNGDLGVIGRIDVEEGELTVSFDGRDVVYGFGELDELVLAYATTIHKSQGSEYPAVVIPLVTQHYAMLARNLLYTGVTRGRKLVVLVGQKKALAIAVRNQGGRRRWSKLREWLAGSFA